MVSTLTVALIKFPIYNSEGMSGKINSILVAWTDTLTGERLPTELNYSKNV